jgi:phosphoribosyl-AMP cyclohydrolase
VSLNEDVIERCFEKSSLIPAIVQNAATGEVLMVGYCNREALRKTIETKTAWFYSRSRQCLWNKGESSGNYLYVKEIVADCDWDAILYRCIPEGPTCHTGEYSCFHNPIWKSDLSGGYTDGTGN